VDKTLSMSKQISEVTKSNFFKLSNMYKIRKCLTEEAAKTMVSTMVISCLDYCNSLYYGLPDILLDRLLAVQKSAARLISLTGKYEHITPVFIDLHWLPICQRTEYKILLTVYKCVHGIAPKIWWIFLRPRRDDGDLLLVPKIKRVTFGGVSFSRAGPELWNALRLSLRKCESVELYKKNLKTRLFKQAYNL